MPRDPLPALSHEATEKWWLEGWGEEEEKRKGRRDLFIQPINLAFLTCDSSTAPSLNRKCHMSIFPISSLISSFLSIDTYTP